MHNKYVVAGYRTFFALLGFSAIVTEIATLMARGSFAVDNFFSYFTVQSNLFAIAVLLLSAGAVLANKTAMWLTLLRGAATLYMATTGIVFALLLSGLEASALTAVPWDNIVLHYILPIIMLVDWLINPPTKQISFKNSLWWLIYPIAYLACSLIRGYFVAWYPYPFLNPDTKGYLGIVITSIVITITVVLLAWLLSAYTKRAPRSTEK